MGGGSSHSHVPESPPDSSIPRNSDNSESSSSSMSSPEPKSIESRPDSKTLETPCPEPSSDSSIDENSGESKNVEDEQDVEAEQGAREEEEGECGFCVFMKAGPCGESFVDWENCIQEAEKNKEDIVEKCFEVTGSLKKCMEAHAEYYEPILRAEKKAEEEFKKELEKEKNEEGEVAAKDTENPVDSQDSSNQ